MILRVDREVFDSARTLLSHDTRYFITSIDPSDMKPRDLQKLVRDHWQIENSLHFVKGVRPQNTVMIFKRNTSIYGVQEKIIFEYPNLTS